MTSICSAIYSLAGRLYAILWESRCRVCGTPCPPKDAIPLCPECAAELKPIQDAFCPGCGEIFKKKDTRRFFCDNCLHNPPPWREIHFFGIYDHLLRDILIDFKYHENLAAGNLIGSLLAQSMPDSFYAAPHILAPIPLSKKRLLKKGFNQALELARPIARRFAIPLIPDALIRTRETRPQNTLNSYDRYANIAGSFAAVPQKVAGKHIILVDDVMTTGHTMREAAHVLLRAHAASIRVLVAARTPKPGG